MPANGQDTPQKVRSVHVVNGAATSVSDDGTTCMMQFKAAGGEDFALTFPAHGLKVVRTMLANLMRDVARHDAGALGVPIRRIQTIQVQRHDGVRGHVLVVLDANLPEETAFVLPDMVGFEIGTEMRNQAGAGLSPEQRVKVGFLGPTAPRSRLLLLGG